MKIVFLSVLFWLVGISSLQANEVKIVQADFQRGSDNTWVVNVTLLHADDGWDHYADIWRLVDTNDTVLAERVLLHPHEDEQPFERGTYGVKIPEGTTTLYVEAHDMVHGWTQNRLKVDMTKVVNGRLIITAPD